MKCWNCLRSASKGDTVCSECGQALKPNPMQATNAKSRLEYLLHESERWSFLPAEIRQALSRVYQGRLDRLGQAGGKAARSWPDSDWTDPVWSQRLRFADASIGPTTATERLDKTALEAFLPATEPEIGADLPPRLLPTDTVALASQAAAFAGQTPAPVSEGMPGESETTPQPLTAITESIAASLAPVPAAATEAGGPEPGSVEPIPALRRAALERLTEPVAPTPAPAAEDSLTEKILAEADIRWFHSLGALLVVAAVVGWLRATWDGYGKNLAGLMILLSPAALHAVAYSIRRAVPISSRLLSILAGLLTAPALLAVEIFDFLPAAVRPADYWTFAFLASGSLLTWQAQAMRERVPLFVGALCMVMAGWSQGPLVTSAICLMVGFALGPIKVDPEAPEHEREWKTQLQKVGFAAGVFGCFSTLFLFRPEGGSLKPLLGFSGALIYLHLPTLTRQREQNSSNRVALQACVSVLGILLMRTMLDVPASGVGLFTLMASALFLSARPEDENGVTALRIGSGLGLLGMFLGFFSSAPIPPGLAHANPAETVMRFVLSLVGAGLFAYLSRQTHLETQARPLGVGAMLATFGGWYHLFLLACEPIDGSYFRQSGQLVPLFASFGLWVILWLVGSRWLRCEERGLVQAVCLPVLLASVLACIIPGLELGTVGRTWAPATLWLGVVALAWERGLAPRPGEQESLAGLKRALELCLPRLALWALALGAVFSEIAPSRQLLLPLQILGLVVMLSPLTVYRQPALEFVWLLSPFAFACHWSQQPFPGQLPVLFLLFAAGWAAGPAGAISLLLSTAVALVVIVGSLTSAHAALLLIPVVYAVALALPTPGREPYAEPAPARYGFDVLLNASLFLPLQLEAGSPASYAITVAAPILAVVLGFVARHPLGSRVVSNVSPHAVLLSGFVWSLSQGPREAGLLLLLASGWAITLREDPARGLSSRDLANGLAILGLAWLSGETLIEPNALVMAAGVLLSECVALASDRWRPNLSNTSFLVALILLTSASPQGSPELAVALLAGMVAAARGLATASVPLLAAGSIAFLKLSDGQLSLLDPSFKVRLLPAAVLLLVSSFWLLMRPEHPTRAALGFHPLASLRLGIALLSVPALCTLAVFPTINDFAWVLAVGCSCLALSQGFAGYDELRLHLKQAGGYVLTGWAAVSLGRAAMALPWQLATLVVGLVMVAVGVKMEKSRKRPPTPPEAS